MLTEVASRSSDLRESIVREAADEWGVRRAGVVDALVLMPFAGAVVVIAAWANRPLFHLLTDDDRLLEWLQFVGYVAATMLGALIALRFRHRGTHPMTALYGLFTLGCLFIAGEEVSWGQRISGWGTPTALERVNAQGETTFHNIAGVSTATNLAMLVIGAVGFAAPWLARRYRDQLPRDLTRYAVPPLFLTPMFLMLFAYKAIRFTLFPDPQSATVSVGEWPELCLACALFTLALLTHRKLARVRQRAGGAAAGVASRRATAPSAPVLRRSSAVRSRRT